MIRTAAEAKEQHIAEIICWLRGHPTMVQQKSPKAIAACLGMPRRYVLEAMGRLCCGK